ncbi:MAG: flagellar basal body P-ring formation chaperone FlgA [Pseudomonadota bacterium]
MRSVAFALAALWGLGAASAAMAQSETALQTAPQTALQTAPQTALQTAPQTALQTAPQTAIQTAPQTAIQTAPKSGLQTATPPAVERSAPSKAIATRNIRAGDVIGEGDLVAADGFGAPPPGMIGLQATRSVYKGGVVPASALRPPIMVTRNSIVAMEYRNGGLVIRTEGRALSEGANGDLVRVMNLGSRQTISARIVGPGQVRVGG